MAEKNTALKLQPASARDELGGYILDSFSASHGYQVATYEWEPSNGLQNAKAVVFLLHGVMGHTVFEWLAPDKDNYRNLLKGSVVDKLLQIGCAVVGYDHPGHGRSSGLHGYVNSHDELRDVGLDVIQNFAKRDAYRDKPRFILGMSMGGSVAIRMVAKSPDIVQGVALISPAVRPPDDMFGLYGKFLRSISPILGYLVPKLPVLKLPKSPDPIIRDAVEKDALIYRGALRVQMCMEFLRVYDEINDMADSITFNRVAIFIGALDHVVSPDGIKSFMSRINSDDKRLYIHDNLGHEVLREQGCEEAVAQYIAWMNECIA